jgi:hypothetical protein
VSYTWARGVKSLNDELLLRMLTMVDGALAYIRHGRALLSAVIQWSLRKSRAATRMQFIGQKGQDR